MKINVFDILPEKGKKLSFDGHEEFLREILARLADDEDQAVGLHQAPAIRAALELTRDGRTVFVHGDAHATIHPPCARCLKPVQVDLDPEIDLTYLPDPNADAAATADERELGADDLDEFTYVNDEIDVGGLLNEQLLLEKPFRVLCSESCKGLCPSCGANLTDAPCSCKPLAKSPAFQVLADLDLNRKDK